jgi:hypothetical protein
MAFSMGRNQEGGIDMAGKTKADLIKAIDESNREKWNLIEEVARLKAKLAAIRAIMDS